MKKQKVNSLNAGRKRWPYILVTAASLLLLLGWLMAGRNNEPRDVPALMKYLSEHKDPRAPKLQGWYTTTFSLNQSADGKINAIAQNWVANRWNQTRVRLNSYPQNNLRNLALIFGQSIPVAIKKCTTTRLDFDAVHVKARTTPEPEVQTGLKIAFYGSQESLTELKRFVETPLSYVPDLDIIFMPAYEDIDPVMLDAMVLHELTHVQQARRTRVFGGTLPQVWVNGHPTDQGADDEIEAHEVGRQVFDIGSKGEYGRRIAKVVASKVGASDPIKVLLKFTPKDLDWVDEALGRPAAAENGYRRSQYFYDLGREWIDSHVPESDRRKKLHDYFKAIN